jgi:ubiquitin carboxyl-terminal hydrolase 14
MVIGTAGELPKPPEKPTVFLEGQCPGRAGALKLINLLRTDMDDSELAEAVRDFFYVLFSHTSLEIQKPSPPVACHACRSEKVRTCFCIFFSLPFGNWILCSHGNTCYMNATVQAMRAIPELQVALDA